MPPRAESETLVIYLEGDGLAYVHPSQPALDPTPSDPVALDLALADPARTAVAWLGRPCQYTLPDHGRGCEAAYWTTRRYAPEIIASISTAVDTLKTRSRAKRLVLVGYSGGGAIAVLLAARRSDVMALVTVAANLDLGTWTAQGQLSPLTGSLDPAQAATAVGTIPQLHFTGGQDRTVGTAVVRSYMARLPQGAPARLVEIPEFTHACCWAKDWPNLVGHDWPQLP